MRIIKISNLLIALLIGALSGCSSTRSANFKEMSASYREVIEQYSNDNILLNIIRASDNMPLSFLDIPSVVGSGSISTTAGISANVISKTPSSIPGFFSATNTNADSSASGASLGMTLNSGFTFTQSSLDNSSFMTAFLRDIPLEFLDFKGTERLRPKTVEYTLLIESIELVSKDGHSEIHFINDPMDPSHDDFQEALLLLIEAGLKVESRAKEIPISPEMSEAEFNTYSKSWSDAIVSNVASGNFAVSKISRNGKNFFRLVKLEKSSSMCINKYLAKDLFGDLFDESAYCIKSRKYEYIPQKFSNFLTLQKRDRKGLKDMSLVVKIRSTGNVFDFLGSVMLVQAQDQKNAVTINPPKNLLKSYYPNYQKPSPLFRVYRNNSDIKMATSVEYKGNTYSIAQEDDSYSKIVMEYLSTLLTISKVPGSIPPSPAVLVR